MEIIFKQTLSKQLQSSKQITLFIKISINAGHQSHEVQWVASWWGIIVQKHQENRVWKPFNKSKAYN